MILHGAFVQFRTKILEQFLQRARLHCTDLNFLKWVVTYWTGFCLPLFVAESTGVYSNQARIFFMLTELSG